MLASVFHVALGGALGSAARYLIGIAAVRAFGTGFPLGVLSVNVLGSFLMGAFVVWAGQRSMGALHPLVATGFLGGFTTFSAFSLEAWTLFERGQTGLAATYVALSVVVSIAALVGGVMVMRWGLG